MMPGRKIIKDLTRQGRVMSFPQNSVVLKQIKCIRKKQNKEEPTNGISVRRNDDDLVKEDERADVACEKKRKQSPDRQGKILKTAGRGSKIRSSRIILTIP